MKQHLINAKLCRELINSPKEYIDRTARCEKGRYGKKMKIGYSVEIGKSGEFGERVYIGPNTMIGKYVKVPRKFEIGRGVCIEDKVSLYDKRFRGMRKLDHEVAVFVKSRRPYKRPERGEHFVLIDGRCKPKPV